MKLFKLEEKEDRMGKDICKQISVQERVRYCLADHMAGTVLFSRKILNIRLKS